MATDNWFSYLKCDFPQLMQITRGYITCIFPDRQKGSPSSFQVGAGEDNFIYTAIVEAGAAVTISGWDA